MTMNGRRSEESQSRRKSFRTFRPVCVALEDRVAPAVVSDASALEQYLLESLNRLRANPTMYVSQIPAPRPQSLNEGLAPGTISFTTKPPLAWNNLIAAATRAHVAYNATVLGRLEHNGANGSLAGQRSQAAGYLWAATENLGVSISPSGVPLDTRFVDGMMVGWFDDGKAANRGHRLNQLVEFDREVGIGLVNGTNGGEPAAYAGTVSGRRANATFTVFDSNPFLTGVAYFDSVSKNNFYNPGEGLGDVLVTASQGGRVIDSVRTGAAGGYSLELPHGVYEVSFVAPDGRSQFNTVEIRDYPNVKLDFVPVAPPTPDVTPPTAKIDAAPAVDAAFAGASQYSFAVTYADDRAVNVATLGGGNVTITGPNGFTRNATFIQTAPNGLSVRATYTIVPPGGTWDRADNGTFQVALNANQVKDTSANVARAGGLGSFTVAIPTVTVPAVESLVGVRSFAAGSEINGRVNVRVASQGLATDAFTLTPFPGVTGSVRTAMADFNRDGHADLVVGTGPGRATAVRVIDGFDQTKILFSLDPFEASFQGGIFVAAGDVTGDGVPELIVTPDQGGGPRVRVFNGSTFSQVADFYGIDDPNFRGGARAAVGDVSGDGVAELLVAAGFGGGPRLAVFHGGQLGPSGGPKLIDDFFVFEQSLRNGVFLTSGDLDGDGFAEVIVGGGPGGGPRIFALSGKALTQTRSETVVANFFAGDPLGRGGVRIAVKNLDGDSKADLVAGPGGGNGSVVTGYLGKFLGSTANPPSAFAFDPFLGDFGGVYLG